MLPANKGSIRGTDAELEEVSVMRKRDKHRRCSVLSLERGGRVRVLPFTEHRVTVYYTDSVIFFVAFKQVCGTQFPLGNNDVIVSSLKPLVEPGSYLRQPG